MLAAVFGPLECSPALDVFQLFEKNSFDDEALDIFGGHVHVEQKGEDVLSDAVSFQQFLYEKAFIVLEQSLAEMRDDCSIHGIDDFWIVGYGVFFWVIVILRLLIILIILLAVLIGENVVVVALVVGQLFSVAVKNVLPVLVEQISWFVGGGCGWEEVSLGGVVALGWTERALGKQISVLDGEAALQG